MMHRWYRHTLLLTGSLALIIGGSCAQKEPPTTPRPAAKPQPKAKPSPQRAAPAWFTALASGADLVPPALASLADDVSFRWMDSDISPVTGRAEVASRLRLLALRPGRLQLRAYETDQGMIIEGTLAGVNVKAPEQTNRFVLAVANTGAKRSKITLYANPNPIPPAPGLKRHAPTWTFGKRNPALEKQVRAAWGAGLVGIAQEGLLFVNAATGQINQGAHTLKAAQAAHAARFDKAACPISETMSLGNRVWVRSTCTGLYRGNVGKKGARVTIHVLDALVFDGDRLTSLTSYTNPSVVAKQLGLSEAKK